MTVRSFLSQVWMGTINFHGILQRKAKTWHCIERNSSKTLYSNLAKSSMVGQLGYDLESSRFQNFQKSPLQYYIDLASALPINAKSFCVYH
jgi:hypothetical protein